VAILFYVAAGVAVTCAVLAVTRLNASHALLFLVVLLLSLAVIFYLLGAPFAAGLMVIVYAGAILVLLLFVVMLLNLGQRSVTEERRLLQPRIWIVPVLLAAVLLAVFVYVLASVEPPARTRIVGVKEVGISLLGTYLIGVELASFLLLAGVIAAVHLGRRPTVGVER
jgi:NADH-quinone oxidoreductase subunit J